MITVDTFVAMGFTKTGPDIYERGILRLKKAGTTCFLDNGESHLKYETVEQLRVLVSFVFGPNAY